VAIVAPDFFVTAVQLEFRSRVVIEVPDFPIASSVTVFAPASQPSTMGVIGLVARVAIDRSLVPVEGSLVATLARNHAMFAKQRICCRAIMLENQGFPVSFEVAAFAGFAEPVFVLVVLLMAGIAVGRRLVIVQQAGVTIAAFCLFVIALQWVGRVPIVLEEQGFPSALGMTACARFAEPAFMRIVLLMAGIAVGRCLVRVQAPLMAGLTFGRGMFPP
jgi:hypothetical protein